MNCVRPPLLKKPARGFGWSCGPCSRKQEKKLEARNTPIVGEKATDKEEEVMDEEEDEHAAASDPTNNSDADAPNSGPRPPTAEQVAQAKLWPYRYLGIHCRVEDALDYDDRIYPRASSRLGPKHQAIVQNWHGHSVELVKPKDIKKKFVKGNTHKKDAKLTKDTIAALEADRTAKEKRPKWVMDEPLGYVARGEDHPNGDPKNTARLQFRLPEVGEMSLRGDDPPGTDVTNQRYQVIDQYMEQAKTLAGVIGLPSHATNFLDKALELLITNDYQVEKALEQLRRMDARKDLKEPVFNLEEGRKFEEGVTRYGSELLAVSRYMGKHTKHGEVVRYYYMWKKSPRGKEIWGNYEGRKGKKQIRQADSKLVDDVADDVDDSAFDNRKAQAKKRGFECKFCGTRNSPQWRRAPATAPGTTVPIDPSLKNSKDKNAHLMLALCQRCAALWRCYGIQWENLDEVARKVASGGGRAWKRRIDEELLIELTSANLASSIGISTTAAAAAASVGVDIPPGLTIQPGQDAPKKKQKLAIDNYPVLGPQNSAPTEPPKKKIIEKPPEPPLIPEQPKIRILPCAADTSLTGTLRKAHLTDFAKVNATQLAIVTVNHRGSTSSAASGAVASVPATRSSRVSPGVPTVKSEEVDQDGDRVIHLSDVTPAELSSKECAACGADASPKWHEMRPQIIIDSQTSAPLATIENNVDMPKVPSQPVNGLSNGHVNGENPEGRSENPVPVSSSQAEVAPVANGFVGLDGTAEAEASTQGGSQRSPSMHDRSSQGPHGPPEAAENPFAVPNSAAHSPPRPSFRGMFGSPASNHERPQTPPDTFTRDGRWPSEGPMANGASASPSLRNLLH
ncbi:hypothetical protein P7C71_g4090, partial [Lecanoromycetidae sp. Uapishka_2]